MLTATKQYYPANERGYANHGWLEARHSFSFADYQNSDKVHFGALRVLNDDIVAPSTGFGMHPHSDMEIITLVLSGTLTHKDSMGHEQTLSPGEVQVMSAGKGITHSEVNHSHTTPVNLLQSWIFPDKIGVTPRYNQAAFSEEGCQNEWQMLVSPIDTAGDGLKIHQNAWIHRARLSAGNALSYTLNDPNNFVYLFVIEGSVTAEEQQLNKRDALGLMHLNAPLSLTAGEDCYVLLYEVPALH